MQLLHGAPFQFHRQDQIRKPQLTVSICGGTIGDMQSEIPVKHKAQLSA